MTLSTQPYKGTRDFYPKDKQIQNYIFSIMRKSVEQFGYQEYDAPLLEDAMLYKAKSGDEIVNEQTYTFFDRGEREVTIRPEMTPTLARMVANKRKELNFPIRWYSIPNLWRYEQPQRGRLREHWQLNVDMIGCDSLNADAEMILIANSIMKNFGANTTQYIIKINNRKITNAILYDILQLNKEVAHKVTKLIDKKEKISTTEFFENLQNLIGNEKTLQLIEILNIKEIQNLPEQLQNIDATIQLKGLFNILLQLDIKNFVFDLTLTRGFDYYTGMIFEVFDTNSINKRSIFGGGRYDELVSIFNVEPISAIGFGMGDVVIKDFLETNNLLPTQQTNIDLYICVFEKNFIPNAQKLANTLRNQNIKVEVDLSERKIQKQITTANKKQIKFIICIGEDEIKTNQYKLKNLQTGNEIVVSENNILENLK